MRASTEFFRLFIRGLAWDAEQNGATLEATLQAAAQARLTDTQRGKVLIGTGSQGTTVNYTLPSVGDITAQDIATVCSELLDHVDAIKADDADITDAELKTALLARYPVFAPKRVRSFRPDFSGCIR